MKLAMLAGLAAFTLLASDPPRAADELRLIYSPGSSVTFEERDWTNTDPSRASMRLNGEAALEEMLADLKRSMPAERKETRTRHTTWLLEVENGEPVRARRHFDELTRASVEGESESEEKGELTGRTVLLTCSAGDDEVVARPAKGQGPSLSPVYLKNHRLAFELARYLPEHPVAVGDTWDLDEEAVREILGFGRDAPKYFKSETDGTDEALEGALREGAVVSGSVEYERREDVDGQTCAVLLISLRAHVSDVEVDVEALGMELEKGLDASATLSLLMEGEERLWFAIEAGRPVRSIAQMEGEISFLMILSNRDFGMELEIEAAADMSGGFEQSWSYDEDGEPASLTR